MLMMLLIIFNNAIIIAFLWPTHPRGLIRVQIKIKSGFLRDDRLQPLRSTVFYSAYIIYYSINCMPVLVIIMCAWYNICSSRLLLLLR